MKLMTIPAAAIAATFVFAQSAQARDYHRHHGLHREASRYGSRSIYQNSQPQEFAGGFWNDSKEETYSRGRRLPAQQFAGAWNGAEEAAYPRGRRRSGAAIRRRFLEWCGRGDLPTRSSSSSGAAIRRWFLEWCGSNHVPSSPCVPRRSWWPSVGVVRLGNAAACQRRSRTGIQPRAQLVSLGPFRTCWRRCRRGLAAPCRQDCRTTGRQLGRRIR